VDCLVEASILKKCAVSIFRAEVICWDSEELYMYIWWQGKCEGKVSQDEWGRD
jgi:hypothetical protein